MSDLIDTTEMYLRTIYELEEEGIVPLRARIAERLHQAGPTVSQTVTRMERDGLLHVEGDRHLALTDEGRTLAVRVMRKHRLAERLLIDVIGLDWESAHDEACRWEHVISDEVERRLVTILQNPTVSPYGNPIPGLDELTSIGSSADAGDDRGADWRPQAPADYTPLDRAVAGSDGPMSVKVHRISEEVQKDADAMRVLRRANALPGRTITARMTADGTWVGTREAGGLLLEELAQHILVTPA